MCNNMTIFAGKIQVSICGRPTYNTLEPQNT